MHKSKRKFEWPEHSSWWERNKKKITIISWLIFFFLLIIARELVLRGIVNLSGAIIWGASFFVVLFLLTFILNP